MTNQEATELLEEFAAQAQVAVSAAVWAQAFLTAGGEPTWDAVKSVASAAWHLEDLSARVHELEARFEEIIP